MKKLIKKASSAVKNYKEINKIKKSEFWSPYAQQFKQVHGVLVLHSPQALWMHGLSVAGAMLFTDGSKRIVVDNKFFLLDETSQRAVLAHEEGHIILGHMDNIDDTNTIQRSEYMEKGEVQPMELEADAYAASKVGVEDVVHMLNELHKMPDVPPLVQTELQNRMFALLLDK